MIQGSLAQNSVRWSVFEDQTEEDWHETIEQGAAGTGIRAKHIQEWNTDWETFCQWVVDEFGPNAQGPEVRRVSRLQNWLPSHTRYFKYTELLNCSYQSELTMKRSDLCAVFYM